MIATHIYPDVGELWIDGQSPADSLLTYRCQVGFCPQDYWLFNEFTAKEHLEMFARFHGYQEPEIPPLVDWLLKYTDLEKYTDRQTGTYSAGNKRKLQIAVALIGFPPLILLDEPTAPVDPASRNIIWSTMEIVQKTCGSSLLLTSHSMSQCEEISSRIGIMIDGELKSVGTVQELKSEYAEGYEVLVKYRAGEFRSSNALSIMHHHLTTRSQLYYEPYHGN